MVTDISERINELKSYAEEEGISVSADSENDLRLFIKSYGVTNKPAIYLLGSGIFKSVWRCDDGRLMGLRFNGADSVVYNFMGARREDRDFSYGECNIEGVESTAGAFGVWDLLKSLEI